MKSRYGPPPGYVIYSQLQYPHILIVDEKEIFYVLEEMVAELKTEKTDWRRWQNAQGRISAKTFMAAALASIQKP